MKLNINTHNKKIKKFESNKLHRLNHFGLMSLNYGFISKKEIESTRIVLRRRLTKIQRIIFELTSRKTITKRPLQNRMGKGKAKIKDKCFFFKKGTIFIHIKYKTKKNINFKNLTFYNTKLSINSKMINIKRNFFINNIRNNYISIY